MAGKVEMLEGAAMVAGLAEEGATVATEAEEEGALEGEEVLGEVWVEAAEVGSEGRSRCGSLR